jgi:hypothetical protein
MSLANISIEEFFNLLDVNLDGALSRTELHQAAQRLGWHWNHAPLYAVLDLLTIPAPLSQSTFISYMNEISRDPHGPYGHVLLHSMLFTNTEPGGSRTRTQASPRLEQEEEGVDLLQDPDETQVQISFDHAGLLIIDPQRSFTSGVWKQSIGSNADVEVAPIRRAFDNCARMLVKLNNRVETMFTRCPFPPGSYDWDERFNGVIKHSQPYFVKPGNSVMWPSTNGFREWAAGLLAHGKQTLVMGGCTLNSCVRVSSIDTIRFFKSHRLQVVVDLSISGARKSNFTATSEYGGLSSVESAIRQMREAGVQVVRQVNWK